MVARKDKSKQRDFVGGIESVIDRTIGIMSPKKMVERAQYRACYDVIKKTRLNKKRKSQFGTFDSNVNQNDLAELRSVARDQANNNPIARGILLVERNGVIGAGVRIQARSGIDSLNEELEAAFHEFMIKQPCDVTGRFNYNKYIRAAFLAYRRDGDFLTVYTDDGLQGIEAERLGTPGKLLNPKHFEVHNGVAYSKKTLKVIGYYIGKPTKWGYINQSSYKKVQAKSVHHLFDPERFSQSRGIPALTAGAVAIDRISGYMDAELVAAYINACFVVFISRKSEYGQTLPPMTTETEPSGYDKDGNRVEKLQPGTILYGEDDESAQGLGQNRPGNVFDKFINKNLAIAGRCVGMPLVLITGDFSGATFMNTRAAYDQARGIWEEQQDLIVKPHCSRDWAWFISFMVNKRGLNPKYVKDALKHEIQCRRWPYADPYKQGLADKQELENKTITRNDICSRSGRDFKDVAVTLGAEEKMLTELQLNAENDNNG